MSLLILGAFYWAGLILEESPKKTFYGLEMLKAYEVRMDNEE